MNSQEITILKLTTADVDRLMEISRNTFMDAFASQNTVSDMELYINDAFSRERLLEELNEAESDFYFALLNNEVVGYLKLNTGMAQGDLQKENALEISRIYVTAPFQGKKIGQRLLDEAIRIAQKKKVDFVWLGVWEKNPGAIRFYKRNGFEKFSTHDFQLGNDRQTDILMKRRLDKLPGAST